MRMTSEPPADYVAFVGRHLEPLRRDAVRVVGDAEDADHLYVDVLTDVATRWAWLELRRNPGRAADELLRQVFARRSERFWIDESPGQEDEHEISVIPEVVIEPPKRRVYVSTAVRLAPMVVARRQVRTPGFVAGPVSEAAIAWWHAYENIRRRRWVYAGFVLIVLLLLLAQISGPVEGGL